MNLKTEEAAQKLRAARAEVEKEAVRLLTLATHSALHYADFNTMASLLKASEIAKKELAACMVEGFV
jgi:hypothetical protein